MSAMPDGYDYDYLVYSASDSLSEQKEIWNMEYSEVVKRMMFKKFDNWVEQGISEFLKQKKD